MSWLQLLAQHHTTWGRQLHVVFPFDALSSPDHQDDSLVDELRGQLLREFAAAVEEGAAGVWRDQDKRALATAVDQVARAELLVHADYGCVVVVHALIGCWGEETAALEVIGLDQHTFAVHSSSESGRAFTATTGAPAELFAGCVPSLDLPRVQEVVGQLLEAAEQVPKHLRSAEARSGERGHQHTPAFIHSVYSDAVRAIHSSGGGDEPATGASVMQPKGGFTDVGLHTGGRKRPTSWPLVTALLWYMLHRVNVNPSSDVKPEFAAAASPELHETPGLVHQLALTQLELWLLESQLKQLTDPKGYPTALLDALMQMLQSAARRAEALSEHSNGVQASHKHTLHDLTQRCESAREQLDNAFAMALRHQATEYRLALPKDRLGDCERGFRHPRLAVPSCGEPVSKRPSMDQRRRRAADALRGVPVLEAEDVSLGELIAYLVQTIATQKSDSYWYHVALSMIEAQFVLLARTHLSVAELSALDAVNISLLLDFHTHVVDHIAAQWPDAHDRLEVERRSRATLWLWVAYCCTHQAAHHTYPELQLDTQFSVPLRFGDLRHLVLGDRQALEALQAVATYLKRHTVERRPELFSLRPGKECDADHLADAYYRHDLSLTSQDTRTGTEPVNSIVQREASAARQRRADHWAEVQKQKKVAAQLRATLNAVARAYNQSSDYWERDALAGRLRSLDQQIENALKPITLFQPLPRDDAEAGRVLFFLRMPRVFRLLATLGFRAQHALVDGATQQAMIDSRTQHQTYLDYHCRHGGWRPPAVATTTQIDFHLPAKPPTCPGPSTLDSYRSDSDGVYHPPNSPVMFWLVGDKRINPFLEVLPEQLAIVWTASFDECANGEYLKSAATLYDGSDHARGNEPVARPNRKPSWLTKEQHLHFAGMRAFPQQQLRNLCRALHEDMLPLERPEVRTLLRQTLFHVGQLVATAETGTTKVEFGWKRDFFRGQARVQLRDELQAKADLLAETPARYQALPTVIDLAAFVASFDSEFTRCAPVLRKLAHAVTEMADEQRSLIEAAVREGHCTEVELQRMKAKHAVLLAYALCCFQFESGELKREDVAAMCRLSTQLYHARPVITSNAKQVEIERLAMSLCCVSAQVMAPRVHAVLRHVDDAARTKAALSVLEGIPTELTWRELSTSEAGIAMSSSSTPCRSFCWEAEHKDDLFHLNLLTGAVLINGAPPGRLPDDIVSDSLYRETFGDRNFEVVACSDGVSLCTARAIGGVHYEFTPACSSSTAKLRIVELSGPSSDPTSLQLLPAGEDAAWRDELPLQLCELYSYWYDLDIGVILLRGKSFLEREVHFVLQPEQQEDSSDSDDAWICSRVPAHKRAEVWPRLALDEYDQLMVCPALPPTDRTLLALTRLEGPAFIHVLRRPSSAAGEPRWLYELPRYQLHFHLHDTGVVQAADYRGHMLSLSQQLPDALANLHQYLILEPIPRDLTALTEASVADAETGAPQLRLLLPDGIVCREGSEVYVEVSDDVRSSVRHVIYDYDDRFRQFKASEIGTRLQLAALHAATSTLLPEPRIGMTGAAMAMALVRQCWVQHPLGHEELAKLKNVARFSTRAPALHLLCYALECSSLQLGFLHPREKDDDAAGDQRPFQVKQLLVPRRDEVTAAVPFNADAATEYRTGMERRTIGLHHQLTPEEEQLVFRFTFLPSPKAHMRRSPTLTSAAGRECFVQSLELALAGCVQETPRDGTGKPECPVGAGEEATAIDRYHAERCQSSWDLHHALPTRTLDSERLRSINIDGSLMRVQMRQNKLEQQMREILEGHARGATMVFRIRRAANLVPRATVADSVRCAWLPHAALLQRLNPHLSDDDCIEFRSAVVHWLQLCVLRDRLLRLKHLVRTFDDELALARAAHEQPQTANALQYVEHQLVQELLTRREWDPVDHIQWLAFEAEGRLQVRPTQYHMARMLIDNPNAIAQLNMGEGKTRVILPLLVLHHTASSSALSPPLVRLVFLPQLLDDAYRHLHRHLCASAVLGRRQLLRLPFHRDVQPTEANMRVLRHALQQCCSSGGALLMAPAHVLSMQLKCDELWLQAEDGCSESAAAREALLAVSRELPYETILDETDEILRHTYQLLYAAGRAQPLPQGPARGHCVQAILRTMRKAWSSGTVASRDEDSESSDDAITRLRHLLQKEMVRREDQAPGAFGTCQLKTAADAMPQVTQELGELLFESLCADPPYELAWLKEHQGGDLKRWVLDGDTAPGVDSLALSDTRRGEMLALRGLLGLGVLVSTLRLRSQVEFGVDVRRIKRLAVPFRANNTPSERAEFAHMDRSLLLTHLAYYDIGLSERQLHDAITKLKGMAQAQRNFHYSRWLSVGRSAMIQEEQDQLPDDNRIDLTNAAQWPLLCRLYRHNIETINFWLANVALPEDTAQFDKRLTATPWMLTDDSVGRGCCGFSGTNDNNLLLPLRMQPFEPTGQESPLHPLGATNGRMLACLLDHGHDVAIAGGDDQTAAVASMQAVDGHHPQQDQEQQDQDPTLLWKQALGLAVDREMDAFIDAGALLVGVSNAEAARFVLRRMTRTHRYQGVVYSSIDSGGRQEWCFKPFLFFSPRRAHPHL